MRNKLCQINLLRNNMRIYDEFLEYHEAETENI